MAQTKFRSLPLRESPTRVDRDARVIYGVSAAQAVEALGHGMLLDAKTIQQVVDLGNKAKGGIKSRFTHPGLSSDGMGKHLGRMKNFRVEGDKAIGDLYLAESASKAPDGDLAGYVMDLAEEDSAAFGMSVVIEAEQVWTLDDGTEIDVMDGERPANALTEMPVARALSLNAVDVVDEPAANRDGMFSQALWGTNVMAESMFGNFDELLNQVGMTPAQAWGYALKYFDARGVELKRVSMDETQTAEPTEQDDEIVVAVEIDNEGTEDVTEEMQSLQAELAAFKQREQDALAKAATLAATVDAMQREARTKKFNDMAKGWQGAIESHVTVLEALGEGSVAYNAYVPLMSALSAQIEAGGLFKEMGRNNPTDGGATALERLEAEAKRLQSAENLTSAQAMEAAAKRNPDLYKQYADEVRGN